MHKYSMMIDRLRKARDWTVYELGKQSGLSPQTLYKWFETETVPTITAIEMCCEAFGITLATFFAEDNLIEITTDMKKLYDEWCSLSQSEQTAIKAIIKSYKDSR